MNVRAVVLAAIVALTVAGCSSPATDVAESAPVAVTSEGDASPDPVVEEASPQVAEAPTEAAPTGPGSYVTLADYEADKAAYAATDVVLFFNADWCSTCKVARDNIQADLASIPSDLTIVVVNFDQANDLRQKYGVTVQHTFVQVDADGNELAKWSGSVTPDEIAQNTV
jgi:thiol:disulfide interchange protein